jgi:hypothetical protein
MNLTWTEIHDGIEQQKHFCQGYSELYHALFSIISQITLPKSQGIPTPKEGQVFIDLLEEVWENRHLSGWVEASLLMVGAIHAAVLANDPAAEALRPFYATVGGAFDPAQDYPALETAFHNLMRQRGETLDWFLREGRIQTNETSRSLAWLFPAMWLTVQQPDLTFTLVDLGTSAGLNLSADYQDWHWTVDGQVYTLGKEPWLAQQVVTGDTQAFWKQVPQLPRLTILRRVGMDLHPLDVRNQQHSLMLKACLWGDQPERFGRFEQAIQGFRRMVEDGQSVELIQGDMTEAAAHLSEWVVGIKPPHLLLIFNSAVTVYFSDASYEGLRANILHSLNHLPDGVRGLWLEHESPRRDETIERDKHFLLKAHVADGSRLYLGELEAHPQNLYLRTGWGDLLREKLDG